MPEPSLTDQEMTNFHQLSSLVFELAKDHKKGVETIHHPHGSIEFVHQFFHQVTALDIIESVESGGFADLEPAVRSAMEACIEFGYRFAMKGYRMAPCPCGDVTDEKIEEFLRGHH